MSEGRFFKNCRKNTIHGKAIEKSSTTEDTGNTGSKNYSRFLCASLCPLCPLW